MDRKTWLKVQIIELQRLLDMIKDHPLMSIGYMERMEMLEEELKSFKPISMAEGENTLREIKEAKSRIEEQVTELVKGFTRQFPNSEIYFDVEYTYTDVNTRYDVSTRLCKVEVKTGVRL